MTMMRKFQLLHQFVCILLLISQFHNQCQLCDAAASTNNLFAGMTSSSRAAIVDFNPHHLPHQVTNNGEEEEMMTSSNLLNQDDNENQLVKRAALITHRQDSSNMLLLNHIIMMRGGTSSSSSIISHLIPTITTITAQSINIAIAAMVASGYIGCWLASLLIQQLQPYSSSLSSVVVNDDHRYSIPLSPFVKKYQWTLLASITHLLFNTNTITINNNALFLPTLWIYSHLVNPTLGGLIGCMQLLLGGISDLVGSRWVTNRVGNLMEFRLPPLLDDENDENINNDDDGLNNNSSSVLSNNENATGGKVNRGELVGNGIARVLSSCSIFTSFPRDCLTLYMGGCAFLTWLNSTNWNVDGGEGGSNNSGVWKVIREQWMPWWMDGLMSETMDRKVVTRRLFALHCIIMLVKGTTALFLQL